MHQSESRDWSVYNYFKTEGMRYFPRVLWALAHSVDVPSTWEGTGRKPLDARDMLFAACMKVAHGCSNRDTIAELWAYQEADYIRRVPHFNTIGNFMNMDGTYDLIQSILLESTVPLREIEIDFSIDATGFGTPYGPRWIEIRSLKKASRKNYIKMHVVTGNLSNIIAAVMITPGRKGDSPLLEKLAQKTASVFTIVEFEGDAAYLSRKNCNIISRLGGTPYFWVKKNITANAARSPSWHRMVRLFKDNREEFKKHYHSRSNVEATFSALKWLFEGFVFSKRKMAQVNEALVKVLCYNVVVLLRSAYELGVDLGCLLRPVKEVAPPIEKHPPIGLAKANSH